jgi:hypothetical protein
MSTESLTMMAVGDLILDRPEAEFYFALTAPILRSADVVVGQGEVPLHVKRGKNVYGRTRSPF